MLLRISMEFSEKKQTEKKPRSRALRSSIHLQSRAEVAFTNWHSSFLPRLASLSGTLLHLNDIIHEHNQFSQSILHSISISLTLIAQYRLRFVSWDNANQVAVHGSEIPTVPPSHLHHPQMNTSSSSCQGLGWVTQLGTKQPKHWICVEQIRDLTVLFPSADCNTRKILPTDSSSHSVLCVYCITCQCD